MSASSISSPATVERSEASDWSAARIDASCRWPLLLLFGSALLWLVLATCLTLITSIKLHVPGFLADCSWLTLGRVRPAAMNAFLFGFASQAGIALTFWLFCRLGRVKLAFTAPIIVAAKLWNAGLTVGFVAILAGASTGFEWLEMPRSAAGLLFVAYALFGICALSTFSLRRERELFPSQWFLLAALFWFPWIYSAAHYLLVLDPVRGTFQSVVNAWYTGNFLMLWLTPVALAVIYYFVPRLTGQPLASRELAVFAFWTLLFLGGFSGLSSLVASPVPRWIGSVGTAGTVCLLVPLLSNAMSWYSTHARNPNAWKNDSMLRFVLFGAGAYVLHGVISALFSVPQISLVTNLTYATMGRTYLALHGFVGMVLLGAIYYVVPRLAQVNWPKPGWIRVHFLCAAAGVSLLFLALTAGGILQGLRLSNPNVPFLAIVRGTVPFIGMSTLAILVIWIGQLVLLVNFALLVRTLLQPFYRTVCAECCGTIAAPAVKAGGKP